jgi:hypothetical protein
MTIFLSVLLILAAAVLFTRLATALSVPYPSFLALGRAPGSSAGGPFNTVRTKLGACDFCRSGSAYGGP